MNTEWLTSVFSGSAVGGWRTNEYTAYRSSGSQSGRRGFSVLSTPASIAAPHGKRHPLENPPGTARKGRLTAVLAYCLVFSVTGDNPEESLCLEQAIR